MKNQKGFSLIELLVVVIIIAIIAAIAIPSLLASRRAANQSAAVANLRTIVSAAATFSSLNQGAYPTSFGDLSGATDQFLDNSWTGVGPIEKNGYQFRFETNAAGYCVEAQADVGAGTNSFAVSHRGVIYENPRATPPDCNAATGAIAPGTALGS